MIVLSMDLAMYCQSCVGQLIANEDEEEETDTWMQIPTLPISRSLVSITTMVELCSHNIRQKSSVVSGSGA